MDPDRYAGFLRAILESPEDDAPRLVFADALEEEGDPRGEFIRVQCELADVVRTCPCFQCARARGSSVCEPSAAKCPDLRRREAELLTAENFWRWFDEPTARAWPGSPLARVDPPDVLVCYGRQGDPREWRLTFRCGFIEAVTLPCADWLAHGAAVVRAAPLARVTLNDKQPQHATDGETEWWGWLTEWAFVPESFRLPVELANHLPAGAWRDGDLSHQPRPYRWRYHSPERALDALATAALAFARAALPTPAGAR